MVPKLLKNLGIEKENKELKEVEINFSASGCWEIIVPSLLSAEVLGELLYLIYKKLNYLFIFFDFQIRFKETEPLINKETIKGYFSLICLTPFLWKNEEDLTFFCEQKDLLEEFTFRRNTIYFSFFDQQHLTNWSAKLVALKEILEKLGFSGISFSLRKKEKEPKKVLATGLQQNTPKSNYDESSKIKRSSHNSEKANRKTKLNKLPLLEEWKERKIFELGVHTKFSTLDGISSPNDYVENAKKKGYAALAVTDHYNVQSFPEFSKHQSDDLKIIYGCELEVLADKLPPYIFNHDSKILAAKIEDLTYCVFDLETTGFFSNYNEIIEIGYVIYQKGEKIREGEYLICPEKEISLEVLTNWYTSIDPNELKKSPKIKEILPLLKKDWQNCVLVAHNAAKFDYGFLNKVWTEHFGEELPYPILDTLPLSWIVFPERKSYSLEKLSHIPGREKVIQTHRALEDSRLLAELLGKLIKTLKEKRVSEWGEVEGLINGNYFPNRGHKVKVLVTSQEGLNNLYHLVTLSHTKRLFKKPCVFHSDLIKHRQGLLLGASDGREGEIFTLFSAFNSPEKRKRTMKFYDYIEANSPNSFRHLWLNGKIREDELKEMILNIISTAEELNIPTVAYHNVHYCEKKKNILKQIVVANEGMNGVRHYLYKEATLEESKDHFAALPLQHLLTKEEMVDNWLFLNDKNLIQKIIFEYPQQIVKGIGKVSIQQPPLNYSNTENIKCEENDLVQAYTQRTNEIFGEKWPTFVQERIIKEWQIIKGRYVFIYWLAYKIVQKTHEDGSLVGSRGSIGSSFIAYLCGITDLNPLPFYKFCQKCRHVESYEALDRIYSCYDYQEKENCPNCSSPLTMEGHNLPFETFFGWKGEKTPDIDLNFSGEYQKVAHNYVRELLGEDSVYRIGTINALSQQTAEIFWREHLKLRLKLNPDFSENKWYKEWVDEENQRKLQRTLIQLRQEKSQLEAKLKKEEEKEVK